MALCFFERAVRAGTVDAALYSAGSSARKSHYLGLGFAFYFTNLFKPPNTGP